LATVIASTTSAGRCGQGDPSRPTNFSDDREVHAARRSRKQVVFGSVTIRTHKDSESKRT
ncbi:hypothetical protein M404DRAFT_999742, partial [Pisolithus tinctorius Marx 270]